MTPLASRCVRLPLFERSIARNGSNVGPLKVVLLISAIARRVRSGRFGDTNKVEFPKPHLLISRVRSEDGSTGGSVESMPEMSRSSSFCRVEKSGGGGGTPNVLGWKNQSVRDNIVRLGVSKKPPLSFNLRQSGAPFGGMRHLNVRDWRLGKLSICRTEEPDLDATLWNSARSRPWQCWSNWLTASIVV